MAVPTFTQTIEQRYIIEPLGGERDPRNYIDHLPEEVYTKSPDSHLIRFLYALVGPVGVGRLRRQYTEARMLYEAHNLELFDLDRFYGNPFQFGRIPEEVYTENVSGLLRQDQWEEIRSKDARYRNRVIDFLTGARAGNTPRGMRLIARSGLGHEVEIIENYKALFDANSDDPLYLNHQGSTRLLGEMIILPRQEISRSEVQTIEFNGVITGGSFTLSTLQPAGTSDAIPWNASRQAVHQALATLLGVPPNSIDVRGGPAPDTPFTVRFTGVFEAQNVDQLIATPSFAGVDGGMTVTTASQGFDASQEIVNIRPVNEKHLQNAIDRIRPITVIPTTGQASGTKSRINWVRAAASSEFDQLNRFVTGSGTVSWPPKDEINWVEQGIEHQAPRPHGELPYQYSCFHSVASTKSYSAPALFHPSYLNVAQWPAASASYTSIQLGLFDPFHATIFPFLQGATPIMTFPPTQAISRRADERIVERTIETDKGPIGIVGGIYPDTYLRLPGVSQIAATDDSMHFWASLERLPSDPLEYLEIDLGSMKAINYILFETTSKPVDFTLQYDVRGTELREFQSVHVTNGTTAPPVLSTFLPNADSTPNPWRTYSYFIGNKKGNLIYTRYLRLTFSRRVVPGFMVTSDGSSRPWSVDVRNLRVGRIVANQ